MNKKLIYEKLKINVLNLLEFSVLLLTLKGLQIIVN